MSKADPATRRSIADLVDKVAKMPTPPGERPIDGDTYRAGALVRKMRRMRALTKSSWPSDWASARRASARSKPASVSRG